MARVREAAPRKRTKKAASPPSGHLVAPEMTPSQQLEAQFQKASDSAFLRAIRAAQPPSSRHPWVEPERDPYEEALIRGIQLRLRENPPSTRRSPTAADEAIAERIAEKTKPSAGYQPPPPMPLRVPEAAPSSVQSWRADWGAPVWVPPPRQPLQLPSKTPFRAGRRACTYEMARQALDRNGGNKSATARELGLTREGLYGILSQSPYYAARRAAGRV
jgi:hypothetical protein